MRLGFIIFFVVFVAVYGSAHLPLHHLAVRAFAPSAPWLWALRGLFAASGLLFLLVRATPMAWKPLAVWADVWFGVVFIAFTFWLLFLVPTLLWRPHARAFDIAALALTAIVAAVSLVRGALPPRVKVLDLAVPGVPPMTVAHLSDIHLNRWTSVGRVETIVERTLGMTPDLVAVTGDLVDERDGRLEFLLPVLSRLRAPLGVWTVPGNHEFYSGVDRAGALVERAGFRWLRNERADLPNGWTVAGLDDPAAREMGMKPAATPKEFFAGPPPERPVLFLYHQPRAFDLARAAGVKLQLSGHLHAGQIPPMDAIIFAFFKYPYGLYREGDAFLYVTSGAGYWGPPMRLFVGSEIPVLRINGDRR
jgi:hypothetical protein